MKDLRILTLLGVFALSLFIYSCEEDEEFMPEPGAPSLSFSTAQTEWLNGDADVQIGETFKVGLNGTAGDAAMLEITVLEDGNEISDDRITVNGDPDFGNPFALVGNNQENFFEIEFEIVPHDEIETRTYTFVLTDANNLTDQESIDITITGTPLQSTTGEMINNAIGQNLGGYDLDNLETVSVTSADADIVDRGVDDSIDPSTGDENWWGQWTDNSGASSLRYATAGTNFDDIELEEDLLEVWNNSANGSFSVSDKLQVDDIILAERNGDYYIIRIDEVNEVGPFSNDDNVVFTIKY